MLLRCLNDGQISLCEIRFGQHLGKVHWQNIKKRGFR